MGFLPIPKMSFDSIYQIAPAMLKERGISLLLLDLDNTLLPYSMDYPTAALQVWLRKMRDAGIELFLVSNNKTDRVGRFAAAAGIPYIDRAGKPSGKGLCRAMEQSGKTPAETALVGDQVYTDVLAANRAGAFSIVVRPIEIKNLAFVLRYGAEMPFRLLGRRRKHE